MPFDKSKPSVMMEFNAAAVKSPTVEYVKRQFGLNNDEIDPNFGVISMGDGNFISVISKEAGDRLAKEKPAGFVQNWSNGSIGPC